MPIQLTEVTKSSSRYRPTDDWGLTQAAPAPELFETRFEAPLPPSDPGYQAQSAADKEAALWAEVSQAPYRTLPDLTSAGLGGGEGLGKLVNVARLFNFIALNRTFDRTGDVRPASDKLFHAFGTVARIHWEPVSGHPYTGMFQGGGSGLARLSSGAPPPGFIPGIAVKLFADGQPSANLVAIHSLDGEASHDFFEPVLSNVLAPPTGLVGRLGVLITGLVADPLRRPLEGLGEIDARGRAVACPRVPFAVELKAPSSLRQDPATEQDFRERIAKLPPGTVLYEVYAKDTADAPPVLIGRIRTRSEFVASEFGDDELFFGHRR